MLSERIRHLQQTCIERGKQGRPSHFGEDYHSCALTTFSGLPHWEKLARAMAYAIENQDVWAYEDDRIGGRIYYKCESPITANCPALNFVSEAYAAFAEEYPEHRELLDHSLIAGGGKGHVAWRFDRMLAIGVEGIRAHVEELLSKPHDETADELYRGALILLDALLAFNDKHADAYEALGNHELAERMRRVPRYGCESFADAVQAFYMQHIVVMRENPFGGNSPGRLDYYLWPYLERDLAAGRCTLTEARELIDELFLRFEERLYGMDGWGETVMVGGTNPDGTSAVNPLTYLMIESVIDLNVIHPAIYVRLPKDPPDELVRLCARYMVSGNNRAQILYDPSVMGALTANGVPAEDAADYFCGGCMEVGIQGRSSDFLYIGWQNTAKILELMITGGVCLKSGARIGAFHATRSLADYSDFEEFYHDYLTEATRLSHICFRLQELLSEQAERDRPSYLLTTMLDDCLERGRNMHAGGIRYHDYGITPLALPNVADGLYAIKRAVFEDKICTADELIEALKVNFEGHDKLRARLRAYPKYGMDDDEVDALAHRLMSDYSDIYLHYRTRHGGCAKPTILTFQYAPIAASQLGATPDGRCAGSLVAQGITPHSASMTRGITAAINSCGKMPFEKFAGGASSMWDMDSALATEERVETILRVFIEKNGQIFQGNTTPLEDLLKARENPEGYEHLFVRVGGYSARFINLSPSLQDDVIQRLRHSR